MLLDMEQLFFIYDNTKIHPSRMQFNAWLFSTMKSSTLSVTYIPLKNQPTTILKLFLTSPTLSFAQQCCHKVWVKSSQILEDPKRPASKRLKVFSGLFKRGLDFIFTNNFSEILKMIKPKPITITSNLIQKAKISRELIENRVYMSPVS